MHPVRFTGRTLCLVGLLASASWPALARDSIRINFESGIPEDVVVEDRDGALISPDVAEYGFQETDSWIGVTLPQENRRVAAACAWHIPGQPAADDWMILPELTVGNDGYVLNWQARSSDNSFRNGYHIAVCEEGSGSYSKIYSVDSEEADWTPRSLSLSAYAGKKIRIAFVSDSKDKALIFIDDIFVGKPFSAYAELQCAPRVKAGDCWVYEGLLQTDYPQEASEWKIDILDGEKSVGSYAGNGGIGGGRSVAVKIPTSLTLADGESALLKVDVEAFGERKSSEIEVKGCLRTAVAEEITGSWCAWCVKGIVSLEKLKHLYPDNFIGMAAHYNDFMQIEPYASWIYAHADTHGLPNGIVNREKQYIGSPLDFENWVKEVVDSSPEADVEIKSLCQSDGIEMDVDIIPFHSFPEGRFALSLVIIEDDAYDEDNRRLYRQHNAYAGGGVGEMGGFENLPEWIEDYHFNDVVRYVDGDPAGMNIDVELKAGKIYSFNYRLPVSENVLDIEKCRIAALLIDTRNGSIVNADSKRLSDFTGIHTITNEHNRILDGYWYTLSGMRIEPCSTPGIYFVPTASGYIKKVITNR